MPTDVFGRGHVIEGDRHAHEDVGMAPDMGFTNIMYKELLHEH